jgi:hypothetical protein
MAFFGLTLSRSRGRYVKNPSDDISVSYSDFKLICGIDDPKAWDTTLRINDDGVWIIGVPSDSIVGRVERHELERHPDGDIREPVVTFPTTLRDIRTRFEMVTGGGCIDPFVLADFVAEERPEAMDSADAKWPWGTHETKLLAKLEWAAKRYWGANYNPNDIDSASTNETVSDGLVKENVPKRVAQIMAQILRPDDLRKGRR